MIYQNAKRCSEIIESVLDVSRGKAANTEHFEMHSWAIGFRERYTNGTPHTLTLEIESALTIHFDPSHLEQILTNLLDNAIRASASQVDRPTVVLKAYCDANDKPIIEVIDQGAGVKQQDRNRLFEPFFTTGHDGSGLGLYICRELCRANQTTISYLPLQKARSDYSSHCFRLHLPHPRRQALALDAHDTID